MEGSRTTTLQSDVVISNIVVSQPHPYTYVVATREILGHVDILIIVHINDQQKWSIHTVLAQLLQLNFLCRQIKGHIWCRSCLYYVPG